MAINIKLLENRLKSFQNEKKQSDASKYLWSPKEGIQTVRIIPYKHNEETPFIELEFYYKLGGKNYLAPCTFGKPDPIVEFVRTLRSSGSPSQKELAKKIESKKRTYAPVIIRGSEELGVKFWGFGTTVYQQLLKIMTNSKWGDITSLTEGNDIDVEFHKESNKKGKDGKSFPESTITPDPSKRPAVDPNRPDLIQKLKEQPDITTLWPLPEYNELKDILDRFLNPENSNDPSSQDEMDASPTDDTEIVPASSPTQIPKNLEKQFDEFFK